MSFGDEDDELNCTLWVGNLDPKITEAALFEIFIQGGPIEKIHIPKGKDGNAHKGYCFITFQHNESVPYTMNALGGTWLCGKLLKLQPRPGSKHKKLMDAAKECDQRQYVQPQPQQLQMPVPVTQPLQGQQQQQQQQWFLAPPPQMAQFQNMLLYPNQMFQPYPPCLPNLNNGMAPTMIQLPSGMTQLIPLPVQTQPVPIPIQQQPLPPHEQQPIQQQYHNYSPSPRGVRPSVDLRQPRPPRPVTNGYSLPRQSNGRSNAQLSSQYSQQQPQVLNGSQSQSMRFPHPNGSLRGPRPTQQQLQRPHLQNQPLVTRNSNKENGNVNVRPTFPQRSQAQLPTFQTSPPLVYTTPMYRHQSPPAAVGGAPLHYQGQPLAQMDRQFYHRPPFPPPAGDLYTY